MSARPARLATALLVLCPVLLTGCGGGSVSGAGSSSATGSAASTGATETSTPTTSSGGSGGDECGSHEVDGVRVRTFCGTGTATLTVDGTTITLDEAECSITATAVAVNAGTIVLGLDDAAKKLKAVTQYIGIAVGNEPTQGLSGEPASADGTYTGGVITGQNNGDGVGTRADTPTFTLTAGRTAGSAAGTSFQGEKVTATWTCGA